MAVRDECLTYDGFSPETVSLMKETAEQEVNTRVKFLRRIKNLERSNDELAKKVSELTGQNRRLNNAKLTSKKEFAALKAENKKLVGMHGKVYNQLGITNTILKAKNKKLKEDKKVLTNENQALKKDLVVSKAFLKAYQCEAENLEEMLEKLQLKNKDLVNKLNEKTAEEETGMVTRSSSNKRKRTSTPMDNSCNVDPVEACVYVSGGKVKVNEVSTDSKTVYRLQLNSEQKWEHFCDLPSERASHQTAVFGDQIVLVCGRNSTGVLGNTDTMSLSSSASGSHAAVNYKRSAFGMCKFGGCLLIAGGYHDSTATEKCEIFSIQSGSWTEVSSMNAKRRSLALLYFQQKVWAIGGAGSDATHDSIETYDVTENRWTTAEAKLQTKRCSHSAVAGRGKFFVLGGKRDGQVLSSVEVYSSGEFSFLKPMSVPRCLFGACLIGNRLFCVGGLVDQQGELTKRTEYLDLEKNVWVEGPSLPSEVANFGICLKAF